MGKKGFFWTLIALATLLNWPGLLNGSPFLFADTTTYLRSADAAVFSLTGHRTPWSSELPHYAAERATGDTPGAATGNGALQRDAAHPAAKSKVILAGRSIYYGAWLYLSQLMGSFWPLAILQSLLTAAAMLMTAERLSNTAPAKSPALLVGLVAIVLLTGAGFFVDIMMPDIFAALGILAVGHLALFWPIDSGARRLFWLVALALAALFHSANLLIAGGMLVAIFILNRCRLPLFQGIVLLPIVAALLTGIAGEALFGLAVQHTTGYPPVRSPFLTARLVEDGPGTAYLRAHCDKPRFLLCSYQDRLPVPSDTFLWYDNPAQGGVFSTLAADDQRALAAEQGRFVAAVVRDRPFAVLVSSSRAFLRQAIDTKLEIFNYDSQYREFASRKLPPPVFSEVQRSRAYRNTMPTELIDALTPWVTALSLLAIFLLLARDREGGESRAADQTRRASALAITIAGGVFINAIVCGALSTPHGRYQSRVLWLLPLAAVTLSYGRRTHAVKRNGMVPAE